MTFEPPRNPESHPDELAEMEHNLRAAINTPVPEDVIAWRYFDSPTLREHAERLPGVELRDLGFVDLTLAEDLARRHLPTSNPVLAAVLLGKGTLVAPLMLINEASEDADVLLAPGTRFRVASVGWEDALLRVLLEIVE